MEDNEIAAISLATFGAIPPWPLHADDTPWEKIYLMVLVEAYHLLCWYTLP